MDDPAFARAIERALEVSPVGPAAGCIARIVDIAAEEGVADRQGELVMAFLDRHDIEPDDPSIVVILRNGYRVYADGDDDEILEALANGIIGETVSHTEPKSGWEEHFREWEASIVAEVEHVQANMHPEAVQALFGRLLLRHTLDYYSQLVEHAFPHLKVDPRRIGAFVRDMRQGAALLLGQDSTEEGMARLTRIRDVIDAQGRTSLLIKEQEDLDEQGLVAKLLLNSALARYVVVENTFPSGHLYELPYLQHAGVVVALLQEEGRGSSHMPNDQIDNSSMMRRFAYALDRLEAVAAEALEWAETRLSEVAGANRAARPWRIENDEVD